MGSKIRVGITLTEVVVGLALLGSLLAMMLVASGKLQIQRQAALNKLEAVSELDGLMSKFFSNGFPSADASGRFEKHADWHWGIRKKNVTTPNGTCIVRVTIQSDRPVQSRRSDAPQNRELAAVEVLIPESALGTLR